MKLLISALTKVIVGFLLICLLLFLPAGSLNFIGGWLFIALLFVPITVLGIVLFIKAPSLLEKRLKNKETEKTQKGVVALSALVFLFGFVLAGLDFRFGFTKVPTVVTVVACLVFITSYCLYAEVMRENAYLSRTIEVSEDQKVIDTGLYGVVRHPMYAVTVFMFLSIPLILGSFISFVVFLFYPVLIAIRILNEEKFLSQNLNGYTEYKQKVKYRLIPFIW
ncbi:MAG: isoprenylcysteine carboxylmethyltransferase family protein [Clostridia bacterium]|nr:isoprenylcysteine carboxylmethyltransferase family protein [Clostridia bacterium]